MDEASLFCDDTRKRPNHGGKMACGRAAAHGPDGELIVSAAVARLPVSSRFTRYTLALRSTSYGELAVAVGRSGTRHAAGSLGRSLKPRLLVAVTAAETKRRSAEQVVGRGGGTPGGAGRYGRPERSVAVRRRPGRRTVAGPRGRHYSLHHHRLPPPPTHTTAALAHRHVDRRANTPDFPARAALRRSWPCEMGQGYVAAAAPDRGERIE